MLDFEQGLRNELQTISGLNKKVFPMSAPEGVKPSFVVYNKSNTEILKTMDGILKTRSGVYDIDILADTYAQLQIVFKAVKDKLNSFVGRNLTSSVFVQNVTYENLIELYEEEVKWYRISMEIRFYYNEEV